MAKTQFVCVATSGPTMDGRNIDPKWLEEMAANYDTNTYMARINTEHVRGLTGQQPFMTGGDVLALKTGPIELNVGGKTEKRTGLFAQLEANDSLVELNKKDQKRYTSIEILPDFAGKGTAYLGGLAVTDSPASLGTERLEFTARSKMFNTIISKPDEAMPFKFELDEAAAPPSEVTGLAGVLKDLFSALIPAAKTQEPVIAPPVAATAATPDMSAFTAALQTGFTALGDAIQASAKTSADATAKVAGDLAAFKAEVEKAPANNYTQRPIATGGDGVIKADC